MNLLNYDLNYAYDVSVTLGRRHSQDQGAIRAVAFWPTRTHRRRGELQDGGGSAQQARSIRARRVPEASRGHSARHRQRQEQDKEPRARDLRPTREQGVVEQVAQGAARRLGQIPIEPRRDLVESRRLVGQARRRALPTHLRRVQQSDAARAHWILEADPREGFETKPHTHFYNCFRSI